ncbi:MAG: glycosyltransferase family 2 protein, partial [Planctomycetes bacterium]|nr:glycosyltransferase family 2 protein [Planctomycetota bacterium]
MVSRARYWSDYWGQVTVLHPGRDQRAIEEARGEWLAHFDDDQIADPSWLEELMATAREKD